MYENSKTFRRVMNEEYDRNREYTPEIMGVEELIRKFVNTRREKITREEASQNMILLTDEGLVYNPTTEYIESMSLDEMARFIYLSRVPYIDATLEMITGRVDHVFMSMSERDAHLLYSYGVSSHTIRHFTKSSSNSFIIELSMLYCEYVYHAMETQRKLLQHCYTVLYRHFLPIWKRQEKERLVEKALKAKQKAEAAELERISQEEARKRRLARKVFAPVSKEAKKALLDYERILSKRWNDQLEEEEHDCYFRWLASRPSRVKKEVVVKQEKPRQIDPVVAILTDPDVKELIKIYKRVWCKQPTLISAAGGIGYGISVESKGYDNYTIGLLDGPYPIDNRYEDDENNNEYHIYDYWSLCDK